jgi:hypothetical protein
MAWLYRMRGESRPELYHGKSVELLPNGFFEGCFPGSWPAGDFTGCAEVFGSGLRIENGVHCFVTPSHTLEALFVWSRKDELAVSNSLCFLLEFYGVKLPFDLHYGSRFASAVLGIDAYEAKLASVQGAEISRVIYDNLMVTEDLKTSRIRKPIAPPFTSYSFYIQYLTETLRLAFANACDPSRRGKFSPLASCSSGYDSAASAAIARQLGCKTAITLRTSRGGLVDSGRPAGEALGLEVIETERAPAAKSFEDVAEFLATGMGGEDYCYRGFSPYLDERILLTGHGARVWELHAEPNEVIGRRDISGSSLQEFRLHQNFIHLPVPMIGARRHAEILAISQMEEMISFRMNNSYDKPICRRLLEESGVARELFGQKKKAASDLFFLNPMSLPSPDRSIQEETAIGPATRARIRLVGFIWRCRRSLSGRAREAGDRFSPIKGLERIFISEPRIFEHQHPKSVMDFLNGLAVTRRRYRAGLKARSTV